MSDPDIGNVEEQEEEQQPQSPTHSTREDLSGVDVLTEASAQKKRVIFVGVDKSTLAPAPTAETVAFYRSLDAYMNFHKNEKFSAMKFLDLFFANKNRSDYWFAIKDVRCKADKWKSSNVWKIVSFVDSPALSDPFREGRQVELHNKVSSVLKKGQTKNRKRKLASGADMDYDDALIEFASVFDDDDDKEGSSPMDTLTHPIGPIVGLSHEEPRRPTHAEFLKRIRNATHIEDFELIYNQLDFMIEEVNRAQMNYENGDRWQWSIGWAVARYRQHSWSNSFEMHRKTVLKFVECLWRRYQPDPDDPPSNRTLTESDIVKEFGVDNVDRILGIFLPMDKANAFFKMTPLIANSVRPGLSWYSKFHSKELLRQQGVIENANGRGPLNRRYIQLYYLCNAYLSRCGEQPIGVTWKHYLEPKNPPPPEFYHELGFP